MASFSSHNNLFILCIILCNTLYLITVVDSAFSEEISQAIELTRISKTTHLHFYFHDKVSGKNPSSVKIAQVSDGIFFGRTMIIDDLLTEGPENTSRPVGKAQGVYAFASQNDFSLLMLLNFAFNEGYHNGSTISIHGRNRISDDVREMPVVGGSGVFRFARGYALAHTFWFNNVGDAIVEYNVYVSH